MLILLLNCFIICAKANNNNTSLRGRSCKSDTSKVLVPINVIKEANVKLLERIYLLEINNQKDSIIYMKNNYINEQNNIIIDFQKRIDENNKIQNDIKNSLEHKLFRYKIYSGILGTITGLLIISLICK